MNEADEISLRLFGKTADKIKYLMVTHYVHQQLIEGEDCLRTGLYSWIPVFNGDVKYFNDVDPKDYEKYDIIHVNLSGQDYHLPGVIRDSIGNDSKTKIVANNDYTVELWQNAFDYFAVNRRELQAPDMIFGTEPNQVGTMEVLSKRKTHLIVHPCFVKRLKSLPKRRKTGIISLVSHRYDTYHIVPALAIQGLGRKIRLIGYDEASDKKKFVTSTMYNQILSGTNYMDFTTHLAESDIVVDPFTLTSQSRVGWDCAALGIPMVGSDRNYSANVCYPQTTVSPYNIKDIREKVKMLIDDEKFRDNVIKHAQDAVEYVSYESSRLKFLKALEEGSEKISI